MGKHNMTREGSLAISNARKGVPPGNKGKKAMHKNGVTSYFDVNEIPLKISEGWEIGSTRERSYIRKKTIEGMNNPAVMSKVMAVVEHNTQTLQKYRHVEGEITKAESEAIKVLIPIGFIYNKNLCIDGIKFPYKPDFINYDNKVIIELDGSNHKGDYNRRRDYMKDTMMVSLGYSVYRFNNYFILEDIDGFKHDIDIILKGGDIDECVGLYNCERVSIN